MDLNSISISVLIYIFLFHGKKAAFCADEGPGNALGSASSGGLNIENDVINVVEKNQPSSSVNGGQSQSNVNLIGLDLTTQTSFTGFDYEREGDKHIYVAKPNYLFSEVKDQNRVLWTATNNQGVNKVVLEEPEGGERDLLIYYPDESEPSGSSARQENTRSSGRGLRDPVLESDDESIVVEEHEDGAPRRYSDEEDDSDASVVVEERTSTAGVYASRDSRTPKRPTASGRGQDRSPSRLDTIFEQSGDEDDVEVVVEEVGSRRDTRTDDEDVEVEEVTSATRGGSEDDFVVEEVTSVHGADAPARAPARAARQDPQPLSRSGRRVVDPTRSRLLATTFTTIGENYVETDLKDVHKEFANNLHILTRVESLDEVDDDKMYVRKVGQDGYIYELKNQNCVEVKHVNDTLWKYDAETGEYPTVVEFSVEEPPHVLVRTNKGTFVYRLLDRKWQLGSHLTNLQSVVSPFDVELKLENVNGIDVSGDETKYSVHSADDLKLLYYQFPDGVRCKGVKFKGENIFVDDGSLRLTGYPKRVYFHKDRYVTALDFDGFYFLYKREDNRWKFYERVDKSFLPGKLEITTINTRAYNATNVNDLSQYRLFDHYYVLQYKFNQDAKCVAFTYDGKKVWERNQHFGEHYPRSISFNQYNKFFFVDFHDQWYYAYKLDADSDAWALVFRDESKKPADMPSIQFVDDVNKVTDPDVRYKTHSQAPRVARGSDRRDGYSSAMDARGAFSSNKPSSGSFEVREMVMSEDSSGPSVHEKYMSGSSSSGVDVREVYMSGSGSSSAEVHEKYMSGSGSSGVDVREAVMSDSSRPEVRETVMGGSSVDVEEVVLSESEIEVEEGAASGSGMQVEEISIPETEAGLSEIEVEEGISDRPKKRAEEGVSSGSRAQVEEISITGTEVELSDIDVEEGYSGRSRVPVRDGADRSRVQVEEVSIPGTEVELSDVEVEEGVASGSRVQVEEVSIPGTEVELSEVEVDSDELTRARAKRPLAHEASDLETDDEAPPHKRSAGRGQVRRPTPLPRSAGLGRHVRKPTPLCTPLRPTPAFAGVSSRRKSANELLDLDIGLKQSTKEVLYLWDKNKSTHLFTAVDPFLFERVHKGARVLWEAKQGDYAYQIAVSRNTEGKNVIEVVLPQDKPDLASPADDYRDKLVKLDIDLGVEADEYEYHRSSTRQTYIARPPYLFHSVVKGGTTLWRSRDGRYPVRVDVWLNDPGRWVVDVCYPDSGRLGRRLDTHRADYQLVRLDVGSKTSTREYEYRRDRSKNLDVFTAGDSYLFHSVYKGAKPMWESKDGRYPKRVMVGVNSHGKPRVTVCYPKSYGRSSERGRLPRPHGYVPELIDLDVRERNDHEYKYHKRGNVETFLANEPYLFRAVFKDGRLLWRSTKGEYPNRVVIRKNSEGKRVLRVFYPSDYDREDDYEHELLQLDVRLHDAREYKYVRRGDVETFLARRSYLFHSVVKDGRMLWEARDGEYPNRVVIRKKSDGKRVLKVYYPGDLDSGRGREARRHLITLDLDVEGDTEVYQHRRDNDKALDTYTAHRPNLFQAVVKGERVLWEAEGDRYPDVVCVGLDRHGKPVVRVFYPGRRGDRVPRPGTDYYTEGRREAVQGYDAFACEGRAMRGQSVWDAESYHPGRSYDSAPVKYTGGKPFKLHHEYKDGKIVAVRCGDVPIWRHDGTGPYPHTTKSISEIMMVAVIFDRTHFHVYKFDGERWDRIRASIDATISLDINNRSSTQHYYYSSRGHVGTYLVSEKFLINTVKLTTISFRGLTTDIWHTDNPLEYARKVVVNRHKYLTFAMEVTIHYINGCEVTLASQGLTNAFGLLRWSMPAPNLESYIKIVTLGRDGYEEVNNVSKFDIYNYWKRDVVGSNLQAIYKCVVMFYKRARCIRVEYKDAIVWKNRHRTDDNYPTKITFNIDTNEHYFEFTDQINNFVYKGHTPSPLIAT